VSNSNLTRRDALRTFGTGALAAIGTSLSPSRALAESDDPQRSGGTPQKRRSRVLMDGHVHVTNKTFWLGIDTWEANYGDFIARFDQESRDRTRAVFVPYVDPPDAAAAVPTPDEWRSKWIT